MGTAPIDLTAPVPAHSLPERMAERWRRWRERRRWLGEVQNAAALGRLDELLHDVNLSRADLGLLANAPIDAGTQFETLAEMAQIDLHRLPPEVLREAILVCARCECRAPCKRWLETGVWQEGRDMRCPNAPLFRQ